LIHQERLLQLTVAQRQVRVRVVQPQKLEEQRQVWALMALALTLAERLIDHTRTLVPELAARGMT